MILNKTHENDIISSINKITTLYLKSIIFTKVCYSFSVGWLSGMFSLFKFVVNHLISFLLDAIRLNRWEDMRDFLYRVRDHPRQRGVHI